MPLPPPRPGEPDNLHAYRRVTSEGTLGDPEIIIWSSIKHLCVRDVAETILRDNHGLKNQKRREAAADNLRLYIQQAAEFYDAARFAKSNTAPLFYYYAFLNLAKARCEIHRPRFHETDASYNHGVGWRPNPKYHVDLATETISIIARGVWHVLWEALVGTPCPAPNPCRLRIRDLFSLCAETSVEYSRSFGQSAKLIELVESELVVDSEKDEVWIRFSVYRDNLKALGLSRPKFFESITCPGSPYRQVKSTDKELWTFELMHGKKFGSRDEVGFDVVEKEIRKLNLFVHMDFDKLGYALADQRKLPLLLPKLIVLYSLVFWLGSLVRYDPHSVESLQNSEYWLLIDGFMSQSRMWLLELFEWEFYQTETTLRSMR